MRRTTPSNWTSVDQKRYAMQRIEVQRRKDAEFARRAEFQAAADDSTGCECKPSGLWWCEECDTYHPVGEHQKQIGDLADAIAADLWALDHECGSVDELAAHLRQLPSLQPYVGARTVGYTLTPWAKNHGPLGQVRLESEHEHGVANDGYIIAELLGPDAEKNADAILEAMNVQPSGLTAIRHAMEESEYMKHPETGEEGVFLAKSDADKINKLLDDTPDTSVSVPATEPANLPR